MVCSPTTACCLVGESELVRGSKEIGQRVEHLTSFRCGVVLIHSTGQHETHELQLELLRMNLKAVVVSSLSQAAEICEYLRKRYGIAKETAAPAKSASAMECIDGVSKKRAAKFQSTGCSVKKLATSSMEELRSLVGSETASKIHTFFAVEKPS